MQNEKITNWRLRNTAFCWAPMKPLDAQLNSAWNATKVCLLIRYGSKDMSTLVCGSKYMLGTFVTAGNMIISFEATTHAFGLILCEWSLFTARDI